MAGPKMKKQDLAEELVGMEGKEGAVGKDRAVGGLVEAEKGTLVRQEDAPRRAGAKDRCGGGREDMMASGSR